ncbi:molybdenum cofactor biosynthesis protein MoaE [Thalassobium sp. R2A62]|jgi:molybdopterin synthase catalytic subunit|uniref:molybdenum cofactor biosynthesis protein MoaE n=1 Tax=Thalassobium sp. R2A62 TaxID=633131 RepID=UPI0001B1D1F5|nr:molybdenum cofactor biosynthesis protein MoaE [Thalassobium sp. R2A62]EET48127.1 molybdopterin converting factor, subunit 2 [Thalassobium sp. R2A62]MDG1340340.1 molybdenum cofactor biosynthesis protein MoaE [Paracoccaceae bacterium]
MVVRVQSEAFDAGAELNQFTQTAVGAGAVVSFTGIVRDTAADDMRHMKIEHYPAMTQSAIEALCDDARSRWDLAEVLVIHRFGRLAPDEQIMMVATASRHRRAAFESADFLMDYLKSRAPFWKKEVTASGAEWVAAKDQDEDDLARWTQD